MIFVYLVSVISGILVGITESINKSITEKKYSVFSYGFIQVTGTQILFFIPFLLFGKLPTEMAAYLYIACTSLCVFLGNISIIKAYKTEEVSNANIVSRSSLIISFLSGVLLLGEKVSPFNILGLILITLGILVIFYEGKMVKLSGGFLYALISGIFFGLTAYFDKKALVYVNLITLLFVWGIFMWIFFAVMPNTFRDIKHILSKYKTKIVISRFTAASYIFLFVYSISRGNISIANTNFETSFLLSVVFLGILFLNEKENIAKKLAGSLLCTVGIILLNFF